MKASMLVPAAYLYLKLHLVVAVAPPPTSSLPSCRRDLTPSSPSSSTVVLYILALSSYGPYFVGFPGADRRGQSGLCQIFSRGSADTIALGCSRHRTPRSEGGDRGNKRREETIFSTARTSSSVLYCTLYTHTVLSSMLHVTKAHKHSYNMHIRTVLYSSSTQYYQYVL